MIFRSKSLIYWVWNDCRAPSLINVGAPSLVNVAFETENGPTFQQLVQHWRGGRRNWEGESLVRSTLMRGGRNGSAKILKTQFDFGRIFQNARIFFTNNDNFEEGFVKILKSSCSRAPIKAYPIVDILSPNLRPFWHPTFDQDLSILENNRPKSNKKWSPDASILERTRPKSN